MPTLVSVLNVVYSSWDFLEELLSVDSSSLLSWSVSKLSRFGTKWGLVKTFFMV